MTRAFLYARYSSDLQSDSSIDDQVRLCREHAARNGWQVVEVFTDYAISGGHVMNRPGFQSMMDAARAGKVDVVIAEALDRISRDQEHIAGIFKTLSFMGVRIVTLSEGDVNELHIGLKGTMNALYIKDLAQKTKRGQRGNIEKGMSAGGLPYGYAVVRSFEVSGGREIAPEQAAVIKRVFREYISGMSARAIAAGLNRDRIPSPRGGKWNASTIGGNRARRNGILNNEMYLGKMIYNRQSFIKDPETGKRIPRVNPESEWVVKDVPELRIIDDETWRRAGGVKRAYSLRGRGNSRRPKNALSGLMMCEECGGTLISKGRGRLECSRHRESGTCGNGSTFTYTTIEGAVFGALRDRLGQPDMVRRFVSTFQKELQKQHTTRQASGAHHEKRLREVERQIAGIVAAITDGMYHPGLKAKMQELEGERAALREEIDAVGAMAGEVIDVGTSLADAPRLYRERLEGLTAAISGMQGMERQEAMNSLRALIDSVVVSSAGEKEEVTLEINGKIMEIIAFMRGRDIPLKHTPPFLARKSGSEGGICAKTPARDDAIFTMKVVVNKRK